MNCSWTLDELAKRYDAVRHAYAVEAQARGAAEAENARLRVHVRYLLDYIGVDEGDEDAALEALGAPPGIIAARAALGGEREPAEEEADFVRAMADKPNG